MRERKRWQGKEVPVVKIKRSRESDIERKIDKSKRPEDEETLRERDVKTLRRHVPSFAYGSLCPETSAPDLLG